MTYTLNASNASSSSKSKSRAATPRYGVIRFSQEVLLLIGLLALVFWLIVAILRSVNRRRAKKRAMRARRPGARQGREDRRG